MRIGKQSLVGGKRPSHVVAPHLSRPGLKATGFPAVPQEPGWPTQGLEGLERRLAEWRYLIAAAGAVRFGMMGDVPCPFRVDFADFAISDVGSPVFADVKASDDFTMLASREAVKGVAFRVKNPIKMILHNCSPFSFSEFFSRKISSGCEFRNPLNRVLRPMLGALLIPHELRGCRGFVGL